MKNELITNEWVFINNVGFGQLFAASTDKADNDHYVETGKGGQTADKYQWKIHQDGDRYFIENKTRGFMFAANGDLYGDDHIVECDPDVTTIANAKKQNSTDNKWSWRITEKSDGLIIINNKWGQMFAAHTDLKGEDHVVETKPGREFESDSKYIWQLKQV